MKWVFSLKDSRSKGLLFKSSTVCRSGPTLQPSPFGTLALSLACHLCPYLSNLSSEQAQSGINSHVTGNPCYFDTSGYDKKVYYTAVISITAEPLGLAKVTRWRMARGGNQGGWWCWQVVMLRNMSDEPASLLWDQVCVPGRRHPTSRQTCLYLARATKTDCTVCHYPCQPYTVLHLYKQGTFTLQLRRSFFNKCVPSQMFFFHKYCSTVMSFLKTAASVSMATRARLACQENIAV